MPDLTDQWIAETTPDPNYYPLSPTVEDLEEYSEDLDCWGNQITIEWATREMRGHQMNWVRLGLVADRVRRYRLYRHQFPNWNAYCKAVLGKRAWQISKTINNALAVMELVRHGFDIVPTCQSQAEKLLQCCKKSGSLLIDAWEKVTTALPEAFLITALNIAEVLGFPMERSDYIPKYYRDRLAKLAKRDGMSVTDKLDELIKLDTEPEPGAEVSEDEAETEAETEELPEKEQLWHREMQELVQKHDSQLWFLGVITHLLPKLSQSSWLRSIPI